MKYSIQKQINPVEESVRARFSMIRPIFHGLLLSTKRSMIEEVGGYSKISFEMFTRIYNEHPGDYGICFEYAVHDAIRKKDANLHPYLSSILNDYCKINDNAESILFAQEKNGRNYVIESNHNLINEDSRILTGSRAQPVKLHGYLDTIRKVFYDPASSVLLPGTIRGIWKADLFLGSPNTNQWVAATLKTKKDDFESAPGLRLALYPENNRQESPVLDKDKNLVMCPIHYGAEFMELFGASFFIAKQLIHTKGKQPSRVALTYEDDQTVAKWFVDRMQYPMMEVLDALIPIMQPSLIEEQEELINNDDENSIEITAPIAMITQ